MSTPTRRLAELGLTLPPVAKPLAAYTPALTVGNQVWVSGQLPLRDGKLVATGRLGDAVEPTEGAEAAKVAALNALAAVADQAGGLDNVARILKAVVFVASTTDFTAQPQVANGASEMLGEVFGTPHVRSAVGVAVLPIDAPVEVELVAELADR